METELTSSGIINKYPEVFGSEFDPTKTLMYFGIETSKYWYPTIEKGIADISKIVKDQKIDNFKIVQIKEKFGGLRVYCNFYTDDIDEVIDRMEEEISTICQLCGSPEGKLREDGWMVVKCDTCAAKSPYDT